VVAAGQGRGDYIVTRTAAIHDPPGWPPGWTGGTLRSGFDHLLESHLGTKVAVHDAGVPLPGLPSLADKHEVLHT